jgi:hypothetical protein
MPRTIQQIRRHLEEVEAELIRATRENRVTEVLVRDYIRASTDVEALDANRRDIEEGRP